jgi:membrane-associated HD superfamily phosphohydrolase
MGNCCQQPSNPRSTELDLCQAKEIPMPQERETAKGNTLPVEKQFREVPIRSHQGSTRKISNGTGQQPPARRRDSQSAAALESNHQLFRKDKKIGNIIQIEKEQIFENIEKIEKPHDTATKEFLNDAFKKHFVLASLSDQEKQGIVEKMFYCTVKKGEEYIFRQGDQASCFFIIHEGEVVVEVNSKVKKTLPQGEGFGELALLYNAPRSASIKAASPQLHCWGIDRKAFRDVIEEAAKKNWPENRKFLEKVALFGTL